VRDLFSSFSGTKERYDWVIRSERIIIEAHGIQHYKLQTFGQDREEANATFESQKFRDGNKEEIADLHEWTYVIVPYTDEKKIDIDYLEDLFKKNKKEGVPEEMDKKESAREVKDREYKERQRELGKKIRREQYLKAKAYKGLTKWK